MTSLSHEYHLFLKSQHLDFSVIRRGFDARHIPWHCFPSAIITQG